MTKRNGHQGLEAIWLKRVHRGTMDSVTSATVSVDKGLIGTVDRSRRRQITILDRAAWTAATDEIGLEVDPILRRANLLVSGVELASSRGRILRIGPEVRVTIGGETTPCERMDEAAPGLQAALRPDWRAGAFATVATGGTITVGDSVRWEDETSG